MARDFAIVLNNGGVNSAVTTALAAQKHRPVMMYVENQQTASSRQRAAFDQQVTFFKPYREQTITLPTIAAPNPGLAANADPRAVAPMAPKLVALMPLIAMAAQYAAQLQAAAIYVGMRVGPDGDDLAQVTEFFQIWMELFQLPCRLAELELTTPLLELEPWQVVDLGYQANVPFERTWSCEHEGADPCWSCRGCRARDAAFVQAAKADPLKGTKR